jgi:hypothetical protein
MTISIIFTVTMDDPNYDGDNSISVFVHNNDKFHVDYIMSYPLSGVYDICCELEKLIPLWKLAMSETKSYEMHGEVFAERKETINTINKVLKMEGVDIIK